MVAMTSTVAPLTRPLDEREMSAWHALLRGHAAVVRVLEAELEATQGLSLPAYEVLSHLSDAPGSRLRMSDLVVRAKCSADARVVYAVLTDAGRERLVAAYPAHLRSVREHYIDRLSAAQLDAVAEALGALVTRCQTEAIAAS
jgi:hypothetical protein